MNYITLDCNPTYMQIGGFGHMMNDILSAYYLAHLVDNLTYVHSPIYVLNDNYHRDCTTNKYENPNRYLQNIDHYLLFGEGEIKLHDILAKVDNKIYFQCVKQFKTIPPEMFCLFDKHKNTLFVLCNNNRVYLNEIMYYAPQTYNILYEKLYQKFKHFKHPERSNAISVCIHIRRGDWDWQPIEYTANIIRFLRSFLTGYELDISIYAIGTPEQLQPIIEHFQHQHIDFHFNTMFMDTLVAFYNCDILIGAHSCFPKIVALFSRNVFIFLPFNDGETQVLGGGVTGGIFYWGSYLEGIDPDRWISTNTAVTKNETNMKTAILAYLKKMKNTNDNQ